MQYGGPAYGFQEGHPYNSRACREFVANGRCSYGNRCKYSHDIAPPMDFGGHPIHGAPPGDFMQQAALFKTRMCPQLERFGNCRYGADCKFAHGQHELHGFKGFDALSQPPPPQQQQQQQQHYGPPGQQFGNSPADMQRRTAGHQQQHHLQQQQQQQQQQLEQPPAAATMQQQLQRQQHPPVPALSKPLPGKVSYVDRLRAMCAVLSVGAASELVSEESLQHTVQAFQRGTAFKENKFADSVEAYLPIA